MSCGGIARDVMEVGARTASGAAKEHDGGHDTRAGFPGILPEAGYCGDIARCFMWDGERTGSGAAKEQMGGFTYPWYRREGH